MSIFLGPREWTTQPEGPRTLDWSNSLLDMARSVFTGSQGNRRTNLAKPGPWSVINGDFTRVQTPLAEGLVTDSTHYMTQVTPTPPNSPGWTIAAVVRPVPGVANADVVGFAQTAGSSTKDRTLQISTGVGWKGSLFDGGTQTVSSPVVPVIGRTDVIVLTATPSVMTLYVNSTSATLAVANSGFQGYTVNPSFCIGNPSTQPAAGIAVFLCMQLHRPWTKSEAFHWIENPWQVFLPRRRIFVPKFAQVVSNLTGGGEQDLKALTESGGGNVGLTGGGLETLHALTQSGGGTIKLNLTGGGLETLQKLIESGGGNIGLSGGGLETLKALTQSGGGTIQSVGNLIGSGAETLRAFVESGGGKIGLSGGAFDLLKALQQRGGGNIGLSGGGQQTMHALTESGGGISEAPAIQPTQQGGAPAWWGYEYFDGQNNKPWWYKDLADKAKELERQRQIRIELGILPKEESKQIAKTVKEVQAFVQEMPTPETADYYMAKAEELANRLEALITTMVEDDDEEAIMKMSRFFFNFKEQPQWQTH